MYFIDQGLLVKITDSRLKKKNVTPLEISKIRFEVIANLEVGWRKEQKRS